MVRPVADTARNFLKTNPDIKRHRGSVQTDTGLALSTRQRATGKRSWPSGTPNAEQPPGDGAENPTGDRPGKEYPNGSHNGRPYGGKGTAPLVGGKYDRRFWSVCARFGGWCWYPALRLCSFGV